jgi:hypothetical protein
MWYEKLFPKMRRINIVKPERSAVEKFNQNFKKSLHSYIQPFRQMPGTGNASSESDRMDAHDLFSQYTSEIIKEDVVFIR